MMKSVAAANPSDNGGTLDLQISDPVSMLNEIARRYESTRISPWVLSSKR